MAKTLRPKIATILLIVNLAVVILPLGSLFFFRIYENQLVRQTESELISQGAVLAATYRQHIQSHAKDLSHYGKQVPLQQVEKINGVDYVPVIAKLDLTDGDPLPDRQDGRPPQTKIDVPALMAGKVLTDIITEAQRSTLAGLKILDYNGVVVAGRFEVGQSFAHVREVADALKGEYASVIRARKTREALPSWSGISRSTGIRIFVAYPIIANDRLLGVAYLSRSPKSILQQLYGQRGKLLLAALAIIAITALLAFLTSRTISRPMKRLVERARLVGAGDVDAMAPMARPGTKEMAQLSKSFSDMAQTLHTRSEYLSQFAGHVSHEFKTPLTSIQGAAELLSEHFDTMSSDERQKFIANIQSDTDRLRKLMTGLLELARADNIVPSGEKTIIADGLQALSARFKAVVVTKFVGAVALSPENFETLFANLVENALAHNATKVSITGRVNAREVVFEVSDDGDGISDANRDKIFTPFFTTRRANGGTGLGLGIVISIIKAHGGTIEISSIKNEKGGATFAVTLPLIA